MASIDCEAMKIASMEEWNALGTAINRGTN
jgi:hypothetical protein